MVEPAICDKKKESGEANDLEVSTPAWDAKISFFHLENCVDRKLEKCSQKEKKGKLNLLQKGLDKETENNCSFCVAGALRLYLGLRIGGHTHWNKNNKK